MYQQRCKHPFMGPLTASSLVGICVSLLYVMIPICSLAMALGCDVVNIKVDSNSLWQVVSLYEEEIGHRHRGKAMQGHRETPTSVHQANGPREKAALRTPGHVCLWCLKT